MRKYSIAITAMCGAAGIWASPALAQSSSGFALSADQTITGANVANATVTVGPISPTSCSGPNCTDSAAAANLNTTVALTSGLLGTSEQLQARALSSDSMTTPTEATATATILDLSAGIGLTATTPFINSLFGLSATTITSTSTANAGGLTGSTLIEGLTLTGSAFTPEFLAAFDASLFLSPDPNTILFSLGGLTIILNEQLFSGDSITTNAIHVMFDDFAVGTGLKSGDLIFASTTASFPGAAAGAVPEPSTWAMMLLGFGVAGTAIRRSRRKDSKLLQLA